MAETTLPTYPHGVAILIRWYDVTEAGWRNSDTAGGVADRRIEGMAQNLDLGDLWPDVFRRLFQAGAGGQGISVAGGAQADAQGEMRAMLDANGLTVKNADGSQCTVGPTAVMLGKEKDGQAENFAAPAVRNDAGAMLLKADGKDRSIGLSADEAKFRYTKDGEGAFVKRE